MKQIHFVLGSMETRPIPNNQAKSFPRTQSMKVYLLTFCVTQPGALVRTISTKIPLLLMILSDFFKPVKKLNEITCVKVCKPVPGP